MHMHALEADAQGPPPMGMCPGRIDGFPVMEPGRPWPDTFMERFKKPPCAKPIWSPTTARELMDRTFAVMKRRNVYGVDQRFADRAVEAGVARAHHSEPRFELGAPDAPSLDAVRDALTSGRYRAFGEVSNQYQGFDPSDPAFDPYLAIAEELDIPMSIHVGTGPPGAPYLGFPKYRARLHSPLTIEEALMKHPKLRVSLMHAGWPMLDDLLAVLWTHPQVLRRRRHHQLRAAARRLSRLPAPDRRGGIRQARDVRLGSDGVAGNARDGDPVDRAGGVPHRRRRSATSSTTTPRDS